MNAAELPEPGPGSYGEYVRNAEPNEKFVGVVVAASPDLLLIQEFHDFVPFGHNVFPRHEISKFTRSAKDARFEQMISKDGSLTFDPPDPDLDLRSMEAVVRCIEPRRQSVGVHVRYDDPEYGDPDKEYLSMGVMEFPDELGFVFWSFDTLGEWDAVPEFIEYSMVTRIDLDSPYVQGWRRHHEPCPFLDQG